MTTHGDMLYQFGGVPVMPGIPFGFNSHAYFVDPQSGHGSNGNDGLTPGAPFAGTSYAHGKLADNHNDSVIFIAGPTADSPTAAITWSTNYAALLGNGPAIPTGARCRIVNTAANDLATLMTISGRGNRFEGIQWFDGKDSAADGQCVLVSGSNNRFAYCHFAGMGDATAGAPATRAGSYSLKVTGSENYFYQCTIGLDTIERTAANSELIVAGARNTFEKCTILCHSTTAGKFLAKLDNTGGDLRWTKFVDCDFICYSANWAAGINNAFSLPAAGNTYWTLMRNCQVYGASVGWSDNVTHLLSADPAPNAGFGVAVAATT